jgi:hypothetical protein
MPSQADTEARIARLEKSTDPAIRAEAKRLREQSKRKLTTAAGHSDLSGHGANFDRAMSLHAKGSTLPAMRGNTLELPVPVGSDLDTLRKQYYGGTR